jgi:hypothetical protein
MTDTRTDTGTGTGTATDTRTDTGTGTGAAPATGTGAAPGAVASIRWQADPDGVVILTMDAPGQSANTLSAQFVADLTAAVARLRAERDTIAGVVLTSAKKTFFAGGDLNELVALRPQERRLVHRARERHQGAIAGHRDAGQAGGCRHQRRRARRRPRARARRPP